MTSRKQSGAAPRCPKGNYLDAPTWLRTLFRAAIKPRPRLKIWQWIDRHVRIPEGSGGPCPGPMRTSRMPIFRGLYDIIEQRHVHFFTFIASARIGKSLLSICLLLYWIAEKFGQPVWLDPTASSAKKLVRNELDEFLLQCEPVRAQAIAPPPSPASRQYWQLLTKQFRGKLFRIIGSGAEADLHGFNAELAINNELDQQRRSFDRDAASSDKIEARTSLFEGSRLILDNTTPGEGGENSPGWIKFLARSQRYCYLPCPHCSADKKAEIETIGGGYAARIDSASDRTVVNDIPDTDFVPPSWDDVEPGRSPLSYEPWLRGWQRLTFSVEQKMVPFDAALEYLPRNTPRASWREETTGRFKFDQFAIYEERPRLDDPTRNEQVKIGYDIAAVETGTTYECAHCKRQIDHAELGWMQDRFRWMAHHPNCVVPQSPRDKESAHLWSAYNIFRRWGAIAKQFIEAVEQSKGGNVGPLITFNHMVLGRPFVRAGASIKEDDLDRVIARTPHRYVQGQLPREPELLTVTVDEQDDQLWFVIRAWGILWDHPDWPTWSALVDWGEAISQKQILEYCGLAPMENGHVRKFKWIDKNSSSQSDDPDATSRCRDYIVTAGLWDSGDGDVTKKVYEFCVAHREVFSPYKGGDWSKTRGSPIRLSPVMDEQIELVWAVSDFFAHSLYFDCIKNGATIAGPIHWWLPANLDKHYRAQLTDEYYGEDKNGRKTYIARTGNNHLGDGEKMQRVFTGKIEERFDELRAERRAELAREQAEKKAKERAAE